MIITYNNIVWRKGQIQASIFEEIEPNSISTVAPGYAEFCLGRGRASEVGRMHLDVPCFMFLDDVSWSFLLLFSVSFFLPFFTPESSSHCIRIVSSLFQLSHDRSDAWLWWQIYLFLWVTASHHQSLSTICMKMPQWCESEWSGQSGHYYSEALCWHMFFAVFSCELLYLKPNEPNLCCHLPPNGGCTASKRQWIYRSL